MFLRERKVRVVDREVDFIIKRADRDLTSDHGYSTRVMIQVGYQFMGTIHPFTAFDCEAGMVVVSLFTCSCSRVQCVGKHYKDFKVVCEVQLITRVVEGR